MDQSSALKAILEQITQRKTGPIVGSVIYDKNNKPMPVLDWDVFEQQLLKPIYGKGSYKRDRNKSFSKQLGWNIGRGANVRIHGLKDSYIVDNGGESGGPDYSELLKVAKENNFDLKKYTTQQQRDFGGGTVWTEDIIDYTRLNRDLVKKAVVDKINDPNTIYNIVGDRIKTSGLDTGKDNKDLSTVYFRRSGNRLIPIARNDSRESSTWVDFRDQGLPFLASALMPVLAPGVGAVIGKSLGLTGTAANIAGGAVLGAGKSAVFGGDVLRGALTGGLGGATGGISKAFVDAGLGATTAELITRSLVGAGSSAINKGDPIRGAFMGALGTNTGSNSLNVLLGILSKTLAQRKTSSPSPSGSSGRVNPIQNRLMNRG